MATLKRRRAVTSSSEVRVGGCRATSATHVLSKHPVRPDWVFVLHRKIQSSFPRAVLPYLARARVNGRIGGGRYKFSATQQAEAIKMIRIGEKSQAEIRRTVQCR